MLNVHYFPSWVTDYLSYRTSQAECKHLFQCLLSPKDFSWSLCQLGTGTTSDSFPALLIGHLWRPGQAKAGFTFDFCVGVPWTCASGIPSQSDPWGQRVLLNCNKNRPAPYSWENSAAVTNKYFKRNKWACHSS